MVGPYGPLVGAIDQGTSSSRFLVFAARTSELVTYHQEQVATSTPRTGWVEQDPAELVDTVATCVERTVSNLRQLGVDPADIVCVGVANQRETTIVWDKTTGRPLHPAIVWSDVRTSETVSALLARLPREEGSSNVLVHRCGLPISTYFSALKLRWLFDNCPAVGQAAADGRLMFGTVDSWLIWNLTGGPGTGVHMTDVTNASRTMLMNIHSLEWDGQLLGFFDLPRHILPEIRSSSEIYGRLSSGSLQGVPISGCLGDQQAALVGQQCFRPGQTKATYGTGCFILTNVGTRPVESQHGLLATVGYKVGDRPPVYALEGSIASAGSALDWLSTVIGTTDGEIGRRREMMEEGETGDDDTGDVYFVTAFGGLLAPHWRPDARGTIVGLTQFTRREHLVRACMESICYQVRELVDTVTAECGVQLSRLLVDGGLSQNDQLMQLQADLLGLTVDRPSMSETTALGAALVAGQAAGIAVLDMESSPPPTTDSFQPRMEEDRRDVKLERWRQAVTRSLGWSRTEDEGRRLPSDRHRLISSVPGCVYVFTSIALHFLSQVRPPS